MQEFHQAADRIGLLKETAVEEGRTTILFLTATIGGNRVSEGAHFK